MTDIERTGRPIVRTRPASLRAVFDGPPYVVLHARHVPREFWTLDAAMDYARSISEPRVNVNPPHLYAND